MGAYLSAPVTNKEFFEGSSPDVIYGGASMQVCLFGRPDASGLLHETSAWRHMCLSPSAVASVSCRGGEELWKTLISLR